MLLKAGELHLLIYEFENILFLNEDEERLKGY
jgi:hypothetical protein